MSGKSQTIGDFTVSRLPQILPINENSKSYRYPRSPGMDGDKSGELGAFLFSRRVPDFCDGRQSFPTNENSNLLRRGRRRWILWSAICFKIMTRYTFCFFPRILAIIPATRYTCGFLSRILAFIPKYMTILLQTHIYMRTKKPIYMRYKQACGRWGHRMSSYKRHRIIPSAKKNRHVRRS